MEDFLINLAYIRSTVYIILLSMAIISMVRLFRKIRLFAVGLIIAMAGALLSLIATYFVNGIDPRGISAAILTVCLLIWAILWVIDFANYEKD